MVGQYNIDFVGIDDGKYSEILNNCTRFESNRILK